MSISLADSIEKVDSHEEELTALNEEYDDRCTDLMAQRDAIDEEVRKTNLAYTMARGEVAKKHGVKESPMYRLDSYTWTAKPFDGLKTLLA